MLEVRRQAAVARHRGPPVRQHLHRRAARVHHRLDGEDHALDDIRYACMSRPYRASITTREDRNPYLVANAFKLNELRD